MPQGLSPEQFRNLSERVRARANELGLGDDILVQGSRAGGTARAGSDIDVAIRVSPDRFSQIIYDPNIVPKRILNPSPGSAAERTPNMTIQQGRIHRGEAGLRNLARELEVELGMGLICQSSGRAVHSITRQ
ncbi:nucleotidyltransferase domain-containing protein [Roseobacter weihaiensis]|uniref:nucleotidyltransferase domain-containing protein n=1 Tax=Roseobacter weihaiensis TaxID=2763262 RepID=UPI001D0A578A|nr:nucleotidyltransferase domain-containing protein [Roseobacter sp. H9]